MNFVPLAAASVCLAFVTFGAVAQDDPIQTRQQTMKDIGKATGMGAKMVKGETPFDQATAAEVFTTIHDGIVKFPEYFPEGSETGHDTAAKPEIWSDREGFEAAAAELEEVSAKYMDAVPADLDSFKTAFQEMTGECGDCHKEYRVKKD